MRASPLGPRIERVRGWNFTDWDDEIAVDVPLDASGGTGWSHQSGCAADSTCRGRLL
jgi:hypothetical protein